MNILDWIGNAIQHFLWTYDIDVFSVVHRFANEWHVLKAEYGKISFLEYLKPIAMISISKSIYYLTIECSLSKHTSNECAIFNVWLDLTNNIIFGVSR